LLRRPQYDPAPQDAANTDRGRRSYGLLLAQAFKGFLLSVQRLPGFVGILPQLPLRTAQLFGVQPGLIERKTLTLHRLTQAVVFALQLVNAVFCLLKQTRLRRRRAVCCRELRGKFRRFFACGFKTVAGDGQLRACLAETVNTARLASSSFNLARLC
jgi:hypothetical protein